MRGMDITNLLDKLGMCVYLPDITHIHDLESVTVNYEICW